MIALQGAPIVVRHEPDDDLDHLVCCRDENTSICSLDLTNVEWAVGDEDVTMCVVCDDLWRLRICPYGSRCH